MADFARQVIVNLDNNELTVNGEEFPWFYTGVTPTIAESPDGTLYPGVTLTLVCSDVRAYKPSEVIDDGD